ncbi:hypothetical protein B0H12DRAFT_1228471 [Mycena haematopus]|nr:hypothetical protein B0H12DRAFT_1228471 [Mycena haematopus]
MAAIYAVYTSPTHPPIPNHLPTLIVTPHGQPSNILYSYLHTNFAISASQSFSPAAKGPRREGLCFRPRPLSSSRVVRCEASRNLKWSIANTGVISPIYKLSLPSPDSPDLPLFQVSKPNPNAAFWSMFYFAYAGHNIPPKRIEFGKIQKNPPGPNGGGTRISITGKTPEEKAVWQTLGEGNEDCVEWVVLCAALNLLDDEILKAADKNPGGPPSAGPVPVSLRDPGPGPANGPGAPLPRSNGSIQRPGPPQQQPGARPPPGPGGGPMPMQQRPPPGAGPPIQQGPGGPPMQQGPPSMQQGPSQMQQGPPPMQQIQGGPRPPPGFAPGQRPPPGPGGQPMPMRNGNMPPPGPGQPGGMPMQQRPPPGPGGQPMPMRNGNMPPQGPPPQGYGPGPGPGGRGPPPQGYGPPQPGYGPGPGQGPVRQGTPQGGPMMPPMRNGTMPPQGPPPQGYGPGPGARGPPPQQMQQGPPPQQMQQQQVQHGRRF